MSRSTKVVAEPNDLYRDHYQLWQGIVYQTMNDVHARLRDRKHSSTEIIRLPSVFCPEEAVVDLSGYLLQERDTTSKSRLLFIPYWINGSWVSVIQ